MSSTARPAAEGTGSHRQQRVQVRRGRVRRDEPEVVDPRPSAVVAEWHWRAGLDPRSAHRP